MSPAANPPAIGWDAIDAALKPLYGDQEPLHAAAVPHRSLGGKDPLDGISVYRRDTPVPHWHYVSYGLTELYAKETDDPAVNGYGFELTFRLRRQAETKPPTWPLDVMQNLARYVFNTGKTFAAGHTFFCNGPLALGTDTQLCAIVFTADPELGDYTCAHGRASFVQLTGLTADEYEAIQQWSTASFVALMQTKQPLWITDLARGSIMADPALAAQVAAGVAREGSSTGGLYLDNLHWEEQHPLFRRPTARVIFGANQATTLAQLLPARLPHGRTLDLFGRDQSVQLAAADANAWEVDGTTLKVRLTPTALQELVAQLEPKAKFFDCPSFPRLTFQICKSTIKDASGKVVRVVG